MSTTDRIRTRGYAYLPQWDRTCDPEEAEYLLEHGICVPERQGSYWLRMA